MDRVAIIGMACRYPEAHDPEGLWQNVMGRRRSFHRLPPQRLPLHDYGGPGVDQTYVTHAGLIDGWQFDRQRFRVPGETFRAVDATHWLALDVSAAALADAGLPGGDGLDRARAGVVLGNSLTGEFSRAVALRTRWPYVRRAVAAALSESTLAPAERADLLDAVERRYKAPFPAPSDETLAGALSNTIAGRICNHFDLHGTGYTVDGACASSLLAVSAAADAVAAGQLEVALAGGVDLSIDPFELVGFARLGALARDEMRVYDRRPTGFLPGEGCGMVVLCRESYAHRHGLRAYAYLLGWGASSDGNGGLTRPELAGQHLALRRAYERAGLAPDRVGLVEGHGTGTEVGDRTELRALLDVRGPTKRVAALGSVKANIGHTKAAAGVAGLIKATLAVHRETLPPTTGCVDPHPLIADRLSTLQVLDGARPWPTAERYAAVSAMGFGGINAHVVLGGVASTRRHRLARPERRLAARHPGREVIVCTADDPEQLAERLVKVRDAARYMSRGELTDLAATLAATERGEAAARFAAAAAGPDELGRAVEHAIERLAAGERIVIDRTRRVFLAVGRPLRVALLFPGQGSPCYPDAGVLADLLDELPPGFGAEPGVAPPPGGSLDPLADTPVDTACAQPAIMRSTLAGLRWLDTLGVRAHEAVGHSLGEIGALVWAGALDEADAYALARARGAAMAAADPGPSGMANLRTDLATAVDLLRTGGAVLGADNGDQRIVVSGTRAEVSRVVADAARRGIGATWLPVAHAFHSPAMAAAARAVKDAAAAIDWRPCERPVASTVTGAWLAGEDPVELLVEQLTAPVRFRDARALLRADLLVEVGPGQVVAGLAGSRAVSLDAGSESSDGVATATAALFAAGTCPSVESYFAGRFTRRFELGRARAFLTNPCEAAVPGAAEPLVVAPAVPAGPVAEPGADRPAGTLAADPPAADPLAAVIARVAAAVELDAAAIPPDSRLLADLHLSSLRVGQLAAEVAADLGRAPPDLLQTLATATVEEFATAIAALSPAGADESPTVGVAGWVRVFGEHLGPQAAPDGPSVPRRWDLVGDLAGHPLAAEIRAAFAGDADGTPARLLALPPGLGAPPLADIVAALRTCHADRRPLVVLHHGGVGAAVGRSLAAEAPEVPVLVIDAPPDAAGVALAAAEAHREPRPYAEVVFGAGGVRTVPALRPLTIRPRRDDAIPLAPGQVCVVTGGAKGIGAECAVALAAATGAHMVLIGRSDTTEDEVRATLARIAGTGAPVDYHRVDVTDAAAVTGVLAEVRGRRGPVRAVLHAAGSNAPALIPDLTTGGMGAVLAPKAVGLDNLLAAVDLSQLRVAVTFGSVIGRTGLAGEADYAIANEWLARRCAQLTEVAPGSRWLNIEWSAWSGTGMGERLGVLDELVRQGLRPISVDEGVDLLLRLLATPMLPPTVLVAGRLPAAQTLRWYADGGQIGGRFLESPLVHVPEVELVASAQLSLGTDPYLADHRIDGVLVMPAVLGLEAMAQACSALGVDRSRTVLSRVQFTRPITVPERDRRTLQIAALVREDGAVDVVARSDETGFTTDHFRATYGERTGRDQPARPPRPLTGEPMSAQHLYGPLFFHGPRFQRAQGYYALSAYRCAGAVVADPLRRWFGAFVDQRLELGDPAARDAFLHILQGCVPDRRVLPVGALEIRMHREPQGLLTLDARQRAEDGDAFVFDLTVTDATGALVEEWCGLELRAVHPVDPGRWPVELLGAWLTRTLRRWRPGRQLDLAVARADGPDRDRVAAVAAWLADQPVTGMGSVASSRLGEYLLVAAAPGRVAVDWQLIDGPRATARPSGAVRPPGSADAALAAELTSLCDRRSAAVRVATCREVLCRLGAGPGAPLALDEPGPAPWIAFVAGGYALYSAVVESTAGPVCVCVGVG